MVPPLKDITEDELDPEIIKRLLTVTVVPNVNVIGELEVLNNSNR